MNIIFIILIPFIGTTLGSLMVFLMKNKINNLVEKILLGFSAGIMIASSIWSLIMPSIEMASKQKVISFIPASIGFILGILFLMNLDKFLPSSLQNKKDKTSKMIFAVTMHNIPEGMAVGVAVSCAIVSKSNLLMASAYALSLGIAIQNFPEGAIVSMPLKAVGFTKKKAFLYGVLSGIVEPISSLITLLLTSKIVLILPYLLSFAAGAMIYVVCEELIPNYHSENNSNIGTFSLAIGFIFMMILDVALG